MKNALENVNNYKLQFNYFTHRWENLKQAQANLTEWDTGVDLNLLQYVIEKSVDIKENFVSNYNNDIIIDNIID